MSPSSIKDFSNKFNIYNRFKIGEGSKVYNSQKYIITKINKITNKGIICDIGYSILELFLSHHFNMKRTRPILFNDLKLDIKLKYKQMNPEEKIKYIENLKELRIKQKAEKKLRINEYLDIGKNLMFIRIYNGSIFNSNNSSKTDSSVTSTEIKTAKFCIENKIPFPPHKYFENTFLQKLYKDEDSGEINFWTKNFYDKLLKIYFKEKSMEKGNSTDNNIIMTNNGGNNEEEENNNNKENKENTLNKRANILFEEFKQKCVELEDKFDKESNKYTPGIWMNYNYFLNCFNKFILYKNSINFKYKLDIDNIWYNYQNDIFEEKESSNIIRLSKDMNIIAQNISILNPFLENELYILFEPNGEKNFKSVSSELEYQSDIYTKNSNKFNDIEYSIILKIYKKQNNKIIKLDEKIMKGYHTILNINFSELNEGKQNSENDNEYFIIIEGNKCPFGYFLQLFSNYYFIENYSYNQFLVKYNNFKEKKFSLIHPNLKQYKYYLIAHFIIEYNEEENKNKNKIVKIYNDIIDYDDNYIKNNIEIILINNINHKKINIYCKKSLEINFNICQKYIIEISIRPPQDLPEKKFEYCLLYDSNINFILCPNIQPFFIREKYLLNKNLNLFNELIYPSDDVIAAFDISLEYRPNGNGKSDNLTNEQSLPEEQQLKFDVPLKLSLDYGEKNILKKNFINNTNIRNLSLKGKQMNIKDKNKDKSKDKQKSKENNINDTNDTYIIRSL